MNRKECIYDLIFYLAIRSEIKLEKMNGFHREEDITYHFTPLNSR